MLAGTPVFLLKCQQYRVRLLGQLITFFIKLLFLNLNFLLKVLDRTIMLVTDVFSQREVTDGALELYKTTFIDQMLSQVFNSVKFSVISTNQGARKKQFRSTRYQMLLCLSNLVECGTTRALTLKPKIGKCSLDCRRYIV